MIFGFTQPVWWALAGVMAVSFTLVQVLDWFAPALFSPATSFGLLIVAAVFCLLALQKRDV